MDKYIAFLRGINVGGNKRVPMKELRKILEKHGYLNVKTLLATGNVVFEVDTTQLENFSNILEKEFGFKIDSIILPFATITTLIESDPFKNIMITPKMKLYVSFYNEIKPSTLVLPNSTENESIRILKNSEIAIFGLVNLENSGTVEYMKILDKEYGKNLTTRNFDTIKKLSKL